jgi:hypothetical protein
MGHGGITMKRQFVREYDLNRAIEKLLLAYTRETNERVESINVVPEYKRDNLTNYVVYIEFEPCE